MDPLESLLRPVIGLVNKQIAATTPAREICADIQGSVVAFQVSNTALAAYVHVFEDRISLSGSYSDDADVIVSGNLLQMAKLATPGGTDAIRDGSIEIHGDARIAQSFQRLLKYAKPDLEEELSSVIGDSAAHEVGQFVRRVRDWGEDASKTMRANISEYLQEESQAVPSRDEAEQFRADVNSVRDDTARLEARIGRLESENSGNGEN